MPLRLTGSHPKRRGRPLIHLADKIFGRVLAITREKCDIILSALGPRLGLQADSLPAVIYSGPVPDDESDDETYSVQAGVACIGILGTLVKRASGLDPESGLTSYDKLTAQVRTAVQDPSVKAIAFDIDSPGGESDGMFELADLIYSLRGQKPMISVCNGQMCSAAYALGCAADQIYLTRTGMIGSIGCFMLHVNQAGMDKQRGLQYTYIVAGREKTQGNPHEPLTDSAAATMQAECNRIWGLFALQVARNRNVSARSIMDMQGGVLFGPAAIPLLADRIGGCEDAIAKLAGSIVAPRYSLPSPSRSSGGLRLPVARQPLLIEARHAEPIAAWLASRSNVKARAGLDGVVARLRTEELELSAKHAFIEARLVETPEMRASVGSGSSRRISMLVCPYGEPSGNLGGFREIYQRGCFAQGLDMDPRCLFAHDDSMVLGRKSVGTATFFEDAAGVHAACDAPETSWADDLLVSMRRGDISQASAAFFIVQQRWEMRGSEKVRIVEKALLRDASVVSYAAYPTTTATAASSEALSLAEARLRLLRLESPTTSPSAASASLTLAEAKLRHASLKDSPTNTMPTNVSRSLQQWRSRHTGTGADQILNPWGEVEK
jgi:HK97 family phage prohead protease